MAVCHRLHHCHHDPGVGGSLPPVAAERQRPGSRRVPERQVRGGRLERTTLCCPDRLIVAVADDRRRLRRAPQTRSIAAQLRALFPLPSPLLPLRAAARPSSTHIRARWRRATTVLVGCRKRACRVVGAAAR
uniref:Uncharacterized protein n=1 Tax=Plectus sambesii TaxID=2011161 RepID=A0A914X6Y6_9BILA